MFDIVGLVAGLTAAVVGTGVAAFNVVKNLGNGDEEDTTEETVVPEETERTGIILVHSSTKNIVHNPDCRYAKLIKNPVSILLDSNNVGDWRGCSYCESDKTLEELRVNNNE